MDYTLNLCVSESHGSRRKSVGDAGINAVVITYVHSVALTSMLFNYYTLLGRIAETGLMMRVTATDGVAWSVLSAGHVPTKTAEPIEMPIGG